MEKKDDFKNVNEVEVGHLPNMSETTDEPERLEEIEEPKVLRSAVLCLVTIGILAISIGLAVFLFNKNTKKPVDNNEEVTQEPAVEEVADKPAVDTKPEEGVDSEVVVEPEPAKEEEPEVVEPEPSIDINEDIDNEALATWLATTETPDTFGVYIWDAESETAIEVENAEDYTITKMDELVIRCGKSLSPIILGRDDPYVMDLEYFIYKLDDIESETYINIRMLELTEDLEFKDTDYKIEFILQL